MSRYIAAQVLQRRPVGQAVVLHIPRVSTAAPLRRAQICKCGHVAAAGMEATGLVRQAH